MKRKALSLSEIVEHACFLKLQKELMTGLLPVKLKPKVVPGARRI
jgi:hypothetical protein